VWILPCPSDYEPRHDWLPDYYYSSGCERDPPEGHPPTCHYHISYVASADGLVLVVGCSIPGPSECICSNQKDKKDKNKSPQPLKPYHGKHHPELTYYKGIAGHILPEEICKHGNAGRLTGIRHGTFDKIGLINSTELVPTCLLCESGLIEFQKNETAHLRPSALRAGVPEHPDTIDDGSGLIIRIIILAGRQPGVALLGREAHGTEFFLNKHFCTRQPRVQSRAQAPKGFRVLVMGIGL